MSISTKKWLLFSFTLVLIGGTAWALTVLKANQRLGAPGLKAVAIPGQVNVQLALPEAVLDFTSTNMPEPETVKSYLPKDTSYIGRRYFGTNGFWADGTVILMGADRTSIHRPDYCLPGQGWQIRDKAEVKLSIPGKPAYELPVKKWIIHNTFTGSDGKQQEVSGIYVFWFVTKDQTTGDFPVMLRSMLFNQLRYGVLQRWAYASYFTACSPGQEDATFAQLQQLIAHSVPDFQLPPAAPK
jgi:hypothetical protein